MSYIVSEKMQLKKFKCVMIPRNKDLFDKYHPTDTSKDYYPNSDMPVNAVDGLNKNQQIQFARNLATSEVKKQESKRKAAQASAQASAPAVDASPVE